MSLETRITSLARAIGQNIKTIYTALDNKLSKTGHAEEGFFKSNNLGSVYIDTTPVAPLTPTDGIEYVMRDGVWIQLVRTTELDWNTDIINAPTEFTPEDHNHDDRYYTETEILAFLDTKSDDTHEHPGLYYTVAELDAFLAAKEDTIVKNTAFNKNFGTAVDTVAEGNHNHNNIYYTKAEVTALLNTLGASGHNHDDRYYTKVQIDTLLDADLGSTHTHDDRYYTELEVDALLANKSDFGHNHDDRYYTEPEVDALLDDKAESNHDHDSRYYTESEVDVFLSEKANKIHNHDERYFTEDEVTIKLDELRDLLESQIVTSSSFTPPQGLPVILPSGKNFGKYVDGDVIPGNLSILQVINEAISEYAPANFSSPDAILSANPIPSPEFEVGQSVDIDLTLTYVQNDAGSATNYTILKNGVPILATPTVNPTTTNSVILSTTPTTFSGTITHDEGTGTKANSLGVQEPNTILAGDEPSNSITYLGYLPIFYGTATSPYTTGTEVRDNLNKILVVGNLTSFNLDTGAINKNFQFWLPDAKTLVSVVDINALNAVITGDYTATPLTLSDAGAGTISGVLYTMVSDVPYSENHRHVVNIS